MASEEAPVDCRGHVGKDRATVENGALHGPELSTSRREELANTLSHGLALLATIAAVPVLIVACANGGRPAVIVGAAIFSFTVLLMYATSTVYHALPSGRAKDRLQVLDHAAIFLLIAGTYTPFTLGILYGAWGWTLFGLVWGFGLLGVLIKLFAGTRFPAVSMGLYLGTGWLAIIAIRPLWLSMEPWGLLWVFAGGIMYTLGVPFFLVERIRYNHLVWHLFVMGGTACHFVAVMHYAA